MPCVASVSVHHSPAILGLASEDAEAGAVAHVPKAAQAHCLLPTTSRPSWHSLTWIPFSLALLVRQSPWVGPWPRCSLPPGCVSGGDGLLCSFPCTRDKGQRGPLELESAWGEK